MDLTGVPTPRMDWNSVNQLETFKKFRQQVELIFAGPLKEKEEDVQVTYLLLWIGDKGRDIYKTLSLTTEQRGSVESILDIFQAHVQPTSNPVFSRYKFNVEVQADNPLEEFITNLKTLALDCNYGAEYVDDLIRDRIVFGVKSQKIRERLITEGEKLTLSKAVEICMSYEYAQEQLRSMQPRAAAEAVSRGRGQREPRGVFRDSADRRVHPRTRGRTKTWTGDNNCDVCKRCGQNSKHSQCPAQGRQCNKCNKWNHFAKMCKTKDVNDVKTVQSDGDSDVIIDSVESKICNGQVFVDIEVGPSKIPVQFKVDTGAQVNILPYSVFRDLGIVGALKPSNLKLSAYNGHTLKLRGTITLSCTHPRSNHTSLVEFHVVETKSLPLFGLQSSIDFQLIKLTYAVDGHTAQAHCTKESVLSEYPKLFEGIGSIDGECHLRIKPKAIPVVHPPRRIPVALRERCKAELERMEKLGVIEKVTEPTKWVNSMVVIEKSQGKLRICLDPHDLNKNILRPHYPTRTLDDVLPQLTGAKYFTKLDARSGYWAMKLSKESANLTTFNTPYGRWKFLRMPFGIISAQDEFLRKMDEIYENLPGTVVLCDDILVYGKTRQEHDQNLRAVLRRSLDKGIRLNNEKLEVGVPEIKYFGHVLSDKGLRPDPEKTAAIRDMPEPSSKKELETILGMVNYLSRFAPNLAEVTSPLRELLQKDVEFHWEKHQAESFQKVKEIITAEPVLAFYDPKKPLTLQTDSSRSGIGATLLQDGRPVAYASKSLTTSEKNYAQIELECLGIVFGLKRYHQWIYGRKVEVETDHLPLIPIFKKPLHSAPARLQRMLLSTQQYDIDVKFRPGKDIPVPDTLSRKSLSDTCPDLSVGTDIHVNMVMSSLPVSDRKLKEMREHTENDPQMSALKTVIMQGWPESRKQCKTEVIDFWNYRDELSYVDGLILKSNKIVIPRVLRQNMLEIVHDTGHFGVEKSLSRARDVMFWPRISKDISQYVLNCHICLEHRSSNPKEPLSIPDIPEYPWQIVGTDLFSWDERNFLVVADYYSHYFEVKELSNMRSQSVLTLMKGIFARMGIPQKVISDNGPCYCSEEFSKFAKEWDFEHITSSPYHSQGNGFAEAYVKICKRILTKAKKAGTDPMLGILEYRATPLNIGYSPAQLLMGRQLRSIIPTSKAKLMPQMIDPKIVRAKLLSNKQREKTYYDVKSKPLCPLQVGDSARIQHKDKTWKPATIVDRHNYRSYTVRTPEGSEFRRNRRSLLKTKECIQQSPDFERQRTEDSSKGECLPDQLCVQAPRSESVKADHQNTQSSKQQSNKSPGSVYHTRYGREIIKPKLFQSS